MYEDPDSSHSTPKDVHNTKPPAAPSPDTTAGGRAGSSPEQCPFSQPIQSLAAHLHDGPHGPVGPKSQQDYPKNTGHTASTPDAVCPPAASGQHAELLATPFGNSEPSISPARALATLTHIRTALYRFIEATEATPAQPRASVLDRVRYKPNKGTLAPRRLPLWALHQLAAPHSTALQNWSQPYHPSYLDWACTAHALNATLQFNMSPSPSPSIVGHSGQQLPLAQAASGSIPSPTRAPATAAQPTTHSGGTKDRPFMATLVKKERLSRPGSPKDTWHLELDVAGSAVSYTCGDSLGVYPTQDPADVATVLHNWQLEGQAPVTLPRRLLTTTLYEALLRHVSFGSPGPKLLQWLLGYVPASAHSQLPPVLQEVLPLLLAQTQPTPETQTPAALADYLAGRTLVDLCHELPCQGLPAQELVAQLRPLQPRLYSIASTPLAQPSRIALTVEVEHHSSPTGRTSLGVATGFLTQRVPVGQPCVPVFITPSHFRLPQDPSADIILIGPGTGIAPYIGFLHERELTQASGRNWLFFGNPHRAYDYLYEERLEHWRRSGHLDGLSLAFSRDQGNKVYVQHQLEIHGASVWEWLQGGAYLYVCGDAKHMAKAVEASLLSICQTYGHLDASAAQAYVQTLKQQKRYQRDVY